MTRLRGMTVAAALVAGLTIPAVSLAGTASAALIDHGSFDDGEWSDVIDDFCGVPGMTVSLEGTEEGQFWVKSTGHDAYPLVMYHSTSTEVFTNLANDLQVTHLTYSNSHQTNVTYHDNGTYTVHVLGTGHGVWYDDAGAVIGKDAGQFSYEPSFKDMGTPTDYSDDQQLGRGTTVKSVGSWDTLTDEGYCAVMVPALT